MILRSTASILTVVPDDLPPDVLDRWTSAALVASAAARRLGVPPPGGVVQVLAKIGWAVQSSGDRTAAAPGWKDALSDPRSTPLEVVYAVMAGPVAGDLAGVLDGWWAEATASEPGPIASVAVLGLAGESTLVDLRTVTLPPFGWPWLDAPTVTITRTVLASVPQVEGAIADELRSKAAALTGGVRDVSIAG